MHFQGFVGNEETMRQLSAYLSGGRFPHALLIEGPEGSGRRSLARFIAKAAVCTTESGDIPCGDCAACRKAQNGQHPDILEFGGEGASRSFHIDVIRDIREGAYVLPNEAPRRVILLTGAQGMTEQAQNAMLKILEEPPRHLIFILTCENRAQLLTTIQSRTVSLSLGAVEPAQAAEVLLRDIPDITREQADKAALVFGGIIGQAKKGLQDGSFKQVLELAPPMARAVVSANELELLRVTARLEKNKDITDGVLGALLLLFRDALILRAGGTHTLSVDADTARTLSSSLTREQLYALIAAIQQLQAARRMNMNHTLFLTLLCSRLRAAAGR